MKWAGWWWGLLLVCCGGVAWAEQPHLVLVMADDHGYGDTGYTGHPFVQTPHLDEMAQQGVVFNRFYASAPVCSPTRASFLTGRHPFRTNVPNHGHYLRPQEVTLAEALREAGYVTGHFGKWHIGSVQPGSPTNPGGAGFDEWLSGLNFFDNNPYLSRNGEYEQILGSGSVIATDATIDFLSRHHDQGKPMLAVTWLPAPHDPHQEVPQDMNGAESMYDDQPTQQPGYFREITLLDQQVGRIRKALVELGIEDSTLLLYCSDNGGLVAQSSGGRAKKGSIYEGGLRVPAIVQWPGRFKAGSIDTPVFTADLYPTLLTIAGATVARQPTLDGIDILPILDGKQTQRRPMGFWHGYQQGQSTWSDRIIKSLMEADLAGQPNPFPNRVLKNVQTYPKLDLDDLHGHAAWNDWPWKLHRIEQNDQVRWELYHLQEDPQEQHNVLDMHRQRVERMQAQLEAWQRSVLRSWSGADY